LSRGEATVLDAGGIGFGTGALRRLTTRRINLLLDSAAEEGITHFDTAPMYGVGEAEGLLGRFLGPRRDEMTVTTKIGLLPPPAFARVLPGRLLRGPLSGHQDFEPRSVRASFERSLRRLRTDHVDILLLHECVPDQVTEELLGFLAGCVTNGTARTVGTATSREVTAEIANSWAPFPSVAQVPWALPGSEGADLTEAGVPRIITHSGVAFTLRRVWRPLQSRLDEVHRWSDELGVDCRRTEVMAGLALALAQRDNPSGPTLFSSRVAEHVRATCRHARTYEGDTERLERFERLIQSMLVAPRDSADESELDARR
jgi:hypothetical protein